MEPTKVGLVGFGLASRVFHAPLTTHTEGLELTHVVERSRDTAKETYPQVQRCTSLEELLATAVDLVVIATPSGSHFADAKLALNAGKHVICEKPFTVTGAEAWELAALARERKLVLTVFHNRRWDADFLTMKDLISGGALGEVVEYEARYDRFRPDLKEGQVWRERDEPGSGALYDLGSHIIDQAIQLFGRPTAVMADVRRQRVADASDDYFDVDLRFADRPALKVVVKAGCIVRAPGPRYVVHGKNGSFVKHGLDVQEPQLKEGLLPSSPGWAVEPVEMHGKLHLDTVETIVSVPGSYETFYAGVAAAIREGKPPPVTPEEAALVVTVIELAHQSARTGALVTIPADPVPQ